MTPISAEAVGCFPAGVCGFSVFAMDGTLRAVPDGRTPKTPSSYDDGVPWERSLWGLAGLTATAGRDGSPGGPRSPYAAELVPDDFASEDDEADADDEDFASEVEDVDVDGFEAGELLDEEPRLSLR